MTDDDHLRDRHRRSIPQLGGFLAASTTDFIQSHHHDGRADCSCWFFATVIRPVAVDAVMDNAQALPGYLSLTSHL